MLQQIVIDFLSVLEDNNWINFAYWDFDFVIYYGL